MLVKLFALLSVMQFTSAFMPKFIAQDSTGALIVDDADKAQANLQQIQYTTYPRYQIITPIKLQKLQQQANAATVALDYNQMPETTASNTDTTESVALKQNDSDFSDEFPHDLLEMAQQKLGLRSLDEVPSISELAELLGTKNSAETIKYIRQLMATENGIALIKAYMESADYTDNSKLKQAETNAAKKAHLELQTTTQNLPEPKPGFLQRLAAFFNIYNIKPQDEAKVLQAATKSLQNAEMKRYILQAKNLQGKNQHKANATSFANQQKRPLFIRRPLPYHYPIPLRVAARNRTSTSAVHMNTPRLFLVPPPPKVLHTQPAAMLPPAGQTPSYAQLAKLLKIPLKQLQHFLQDKPKLAELAAKVSYFPIQQQQHRSALIDAQLMSSIQRAIEQDEDLKKFLSTTTTTETLK